MEMKVKCVDCLDKERCFTVGNVYTWKDNTIEDDGGYVFRASADGTDPDKWDLSHWYKFKVVDREKKIVIITNGKDVTARMFDGNAVVKEAQAHCHPDDEFSFETGAKIAFDRLVGKSEPVVKEVHRRAKVGEWVRIDDRAGGYSHKEFDPNGIYQVAEETSGDLIGLVGSFGKVRSFFSFEYVVLEGYKPEKKEEKPKFVPHLEWAGKFYGEIGKETNYVDAVGRKLYIGDVVEVFYDGRSKGCRAIVESKALSHGTKQFVMGSENSCDDKNGIMKNGLKVVKVQHGSEKKNGEFVDAIEYITEEN